MRSDAGAPSAAPSRSAGATDAAPYQAGVSGAAVASHPYRPALDGVRALAVVAVLLVHHYGAADPAGWAAGGFLGVDLFFVLSGFLITSLLVDEFGRTGGISLPGFWSRRVRRLLPALAVLFLGVAAYAILRAPPGAMTRIRDAGIATFFYVQNWHHIAAGPGSGSPFTPMWSLAIEEQWYLVWPVVLLLLVGAARLGRRTCLVLVTVLAALSALDMAWRYDGPASVSTLYHATDTRAQALLIGAALGLLLGLGSGARRRGVAIALDVAGVVALIALVVVVGRVTSDSPWLYQGGFFVVAILSAVLVASAGEPSSPLLGRVLGWTPLRWLGLISYEVYLFHRLVYRWFPPAVVDLGVHGLFLLRVGVTLLAAALVYVFVSRPVRRSRVPVGLLVALTFAALLILVAVTESRQPTAEARPTGPTGPSTGALIEP